MRLSNIALMAIRGSYELKKELAKALKVHITTINRYLVVNSDDLTKAAAMIIIRNALKLSDDEILDRSNIEEVVVGTK